MHTQRFTLTAALPYTNGPIHIGHLAGVYIPADIYARYLRINNCEVAFICGSDEHGAAIPMRAKKEGVSPQQIIDKYHAMIKQSFEDFGIAFDFYGRTSSETHRETASDFFSTLYQNKKFTEAIANQLYDPEAEQFLADRFVIGTCPKCGHDAAYGDQCENCGSALHATDLINPISTLSGAKPILKPTKHWYLPLGDYASFLKDWILKSHQHDWKTNVYGQIKSWIDEGLRSRAVTRDLDWGIPVPVPDAQNKVLYVWFDAPIGYISATKEWAKRAGKNWELFWKDTNTKLIHFIGKDNIVFHGIIFPSMLKAAGGYILPDNIPANEFLNLEGQKLSTSKNWAVWLHEYLVDFPNQQDVLRYVLTSIAPETKDSDFTWKDFQSKNNNELVAIFGNFVHRVFVLTHKYCDGKVPQPMRLEQKFQAVLDQVKSIPNRISKTINRFRFREACQEMMQLARLGNKFLADHEPWKLIKTQPEKTEHILYVALQITTALAVLSEPFLPHTSQKLKQLLNLTPDLLPNWDKIATATTWIPAGHLLKKGELLFSKIEDVTIAKQIQKLEETKKANSEIQKPSLPQKDEITFEDFTKLDIRTGIIRKAQKIPKTKKLLALQVDTGIDTRTIVSGIAGSYTPEEVVGKTVVVLINLAPRKLKGVLSHGMILMTEKKQGDLVFIAPENSETHAGSEVK